jgi:hypothetical protein
MGGHRLLDSGDRRRGVPAGRVDHGDDARPLESGWTLLPADAVWASNHQDRAAPRTPRAPTLPRTGPATGDLLRGLADLPNVRVLVGTRLDRARPDQPSIGGRDGDGPLLRALAADTVVRLERDPAVEAAIVDYVAQRLQEIPESPYVNEPEPVRRAAAEAVAASSQGIFLLARLLARALARGDQPLDLTSEHAQELLRGGVAEAFAADLARYGPDEQRVRDLLVPLAWAEGAGLPRRQVWLAVANALAGHGHVESDLAWLLEHVGAHLIEAGEDGQTVYRLYHQAFNDYLRRGHDERTVHSRITDALLALVSSDGGRNWAGANPYLPRHLAAHAAAAGRLAELVDDARYLLYADPQRLASVLGSVDHRQHVLARLYWRALDRLRDATPTERAAALHVTALHHEPTALPLIDTDAELPWRGLWAAGPPTPFHRRITGHTNRVLAVAVGEVGGRAVIVSGGGDKTVRVWDAETGEPRAVVTGHTGGVRTVAVGQVSARTVIVTGGGGTVRVWDAKTGKPQATLAHLGGILAVTVGQLDYRTLMVVGADSRIAVVELLRLPG